MCCFKGATLADFAPVTSPQIPALVIYCIKEIEKRGLHEVRRRTIKSWSACHTCPPLLSVLWGSFSPFPVVQVGLYRVPGHDRLVKELKEKLVRGKTLPSLSKVEDVNVITGVLKDFFRKLPEPLLTFQLNKAFTEAAGETSWHRTLLSVFGFFCFGTCSNTSLGFFLFLKKSWTMETVWPWCIRPSVSCLSPTETL